MLFGNVGSCRLAVGVVQFLNDIERPKALVFSDLHIINLHLYISKDLSVEMFHFICMIDFNLKLHM